MKHPRHLLAAALFALVTTPLGFSPVAYGAPEEETATPPQAPFGAPIRSEQSVDDLEEAAPQYEDMAQYRRQAAYLEALTAALPQAQNLADVIRDAWCDTLPKDQHRTFMPLEPIVLQLQELIAAGYSADELQAIVVGACHYKHTQYRKVDTARFDPSGTYRTIDQLAHQVTVWREKDPDLHPEVLTGIFEAYAIFTSRIRITDLEHDEEIVVPFSPTDGIPLSEQGEVGRFIMHPLRGLDTAFFLAPLHDLAYDVPKKQSTSAPSPATPEAEAEEENDGNSSAINAPVANGSTKEEESEQPHAAAPDTENTGRDDDADDDDEAEGESNATAIVVRGQSAATDDDEAESEEEDITINGESPEETAGRLEWVVKAAANYYGIDTFAHHLYDLKLFNKIFHAADGDTDFANLIADWFVPFLNESPEKDWEEVYNFVVPWMVHKHEQNPQFNFNQSELYAIDAEVSDILEAGNVPDMVALLKEYLEDMPNPNAAETEELFSGDGNEGEDKK